MTFERAELTLLSTMDILFLLKMIDRFRRDLELLGRFGKLESGGIFRPSLGEADIQAREFVMGLMKDAGLTIQTDAAANIIGIREGKLKAPVVTTGSHIDAGKGWGIFDGTVGVIGAIEAVRMLNEENVKTKLPIVVLCFTDEEGAYNSLSGSKYFAGKISLDELYKSRSKYDGRKFGELVGRVLGQGRIEQFTTPIKYHIELHIEQGPILENENKQIGIVSGIVGIRWLYLKFKGRQAHAGGTPMNLRKDPTLPASRIIPIVRSIVLKYRDMVGTGAYIDVKPNVINAIPDEVTVGIDIRSLYRNDMEDATRKIIESSEKFAREENCELSIYQSEGTDPVLCSEEVIKTVEKSAKSLGYSYRLMPSRAIHDTQNVASLAKTGMIFVPSKNGISHAPDEWTDTDQAYRGVEVLKESISRLAMQV